MEALVVFSLQAGLLVLIWGFIAIILGMGYLLYRDFQDQ